jgi:putative glycosyltransferase (TIGR04372 family)
MEIVSLNINFFSLVKQRILTIINKNTYLRGILHIGRWLFDRQYRSEWGLIQINDQWHYSVSPFLAYNLYCVFDFLVPIFHKRSILFSKNNISNAIGHVYPELDHLNRLFLSGKLSSEITIYYIYPKSPILNGIDLAIKFKNIKIIKSGLLNMLVTPFFLRHSKLALDVGQSSLNHGYMILNDKVEINKPHEYKYIFQVKQLEYAKIRKKTINNYPMRVKDTNYVMPTALKNISSKKYILIQIKTEAINATFQPTNPLIFNHVFNTLKARGYEIIFAGREVMPDNFHNYGVINYASSELASGLNDYHLVFNAEAVIASASGFCYLPDTLGIPLLSINNWQMNNFVGERTISLPSLLSLNNKKLKFREQLDYSYKLGQLREDNKPNDVYCQDVTAEDLSLGVEELLKIVNTTVPKKSPLQIAYEELFKGEMIFYQMSRIPNFFLHKNYDRF